MHVIEKILYFLSDYRKGLEEDTVEQILKLSNKAEPAELPEEIKVEQDNKKVVTD